MPDTRTTTFRSGTTRRKDDATSRTGTVRRGDDPASRKGTVPRGDDVSPPGDVVRRRPRPVWLVTLAAFVFPGSGQMLNGDPIRGLIMQFFMMFLAYVTYTQTGPEISFIGRFAGGIFVYVVSVLDAYTLAVRRNRAWDRMVADGTVRTPDTRG